MSPVHDPFVLSDRKWFTLQTLVCGIHRYFDFNLNVADKVVRSASRRSIGVQASGDAVTNLLVDVTPVFERTRQHGRRDTFLEVTNDVGYQTITRSIVHHLAHQRASLTPVVVISAQRVSGMNEFAASFPLLHVWKALRIGLWAALRVWRIHRI